MLMYLGATMGKTDALAKDHPLDLAHKLSRFLAMGTAGSADTL